MLCPNASTSTTGGKLPELEAASAEITPPDRGYQAAMAERARRDTNVVAEHCRQLGAQQTAQTVSHDLAGLVRLLVRALRKVEPDSEIATRAMLFLERKGMAGSVLRESDSVFGGLQP